MLGNMKILVVIPVSFAYNVKKTIELTFFNGTYEIWFTLACRFFRRDNTVRYGSYSVHA